jgi:glycosyltransferase involved in cell wall biosynthesis
MPSAFLLVLTGDIETFTELCRDAGIPSADFLITSCPHKEVAGTACAADVALLLRSDNVVNRVASPTKFAEYLSMGVPVVITDVLADFAGIVRDRDIGAVVPAPNAPEVVAAAIRDLLLAPVDAQAVTRKRCVIASREVLSFESILPAYRRIYRPEAEVPRPTASPPAEARRS